MRARLFDLGLFLLVFWLVVFLTLMARHRAPAQAPPFQDAVPERDASSRAPRRPNWTLSGEPFGPPIPPQ